jgi:hypothetical protein
MQRAARGRAALRQVLPFQCSAMGTLAEVPETSLPPKAQASCRPVAMTVMKPDALFGGPK